MHHTSNTRKGRVRHCNKSENELGANWQNQIIKLKFGHWLHTGNSLRYVFHPIHIYRECRCCELYVIVVLPCTVSP